MSGRYRPISVWQRTEDGLAGRAELPLAVGTVGGSTQVHPGVRAAFALVRTPCARELAVVLASTGLAANLAALRALASEGIQKGHMKLHDRKREVEGAAEPARPSALQVGGAS
jgi:hydroxymethylglutaryl-CoA reductase